MINKLNELKTNSNSSKVKELCESVINTLTSAIYNGVNPEAQYEIEKLSIENLFEKLSNVKDDKYVSEWLSNQKRLYSIKNIGVRNAISNIRVNEGSHDTIIADVLNLFESKLRSFPEVLLYEEFVNSLKSFSWMPTVEKNLNSIQENVKKYNNDIHITKVLEAMKMTRSSYLIPLIEDVVHNYLNNKNEQNKHFLQETLVKFSYDEHVRNIMNLVSSDCVSLQLEYSSANAGIETIYSPLLYLGENEVMFNVKGTYYVKKGNNINRIKNAEVSKIDNKFKSICESVNNPNVEISKKDIKIYFGKDIAVVNENSIFINNKSMSLNEYEEAQNSSYLLGNTEFYRLINELKTNFDEIVEVDFVKRVFLKENEEHSADIFKLRENICITTYDPTNNKVTFYRNINPIQAEKIMMEHMRFDVSNAFKDILPNKEKILAQISETKQTYLNYINELNEKLTDLQGKSSDTIIQSAIAAINEELSEIKNEYKDYCNQVEKYTNVSEGVTVTIDVDGTKYTVPIPQPESSARGESTETGEQPESEIKMDNELEPASQVTFDNDESELLGANPSIESDKVDLGVDDVEAQADAAEAALNSDDDQEGENPEDVEGAEDVEIDGLGLEDEESEEGNGEESEEGNGEESEEGNDEVKKKEENEETDEDAEPLNDSLEKTPLKTKPAIVEDGEVKPAPKKKLFLKKSKIQESIRVNLKKNLNECVQVGDQVIYNKEKGYVTGQLGDGRLIVQVQGSTHYAKIDEVKSVKEKQDVMNVPFKFDKNTQKVLMEQYVRCGIFMNSVPIKTNECFVRFNEWDDSRDDQFVKVLIEGRSNMMQKNQIKILEDINNFANEENYVPGVIIDESSQQVIENVLINALDYTQAIGDTHSVRIIRNTPSGQMSDNMPAAKLKTLSV